jgi:hypothetical protein
MMKPVVTSITFGVFLKPSLWHVGVLGDNGNDPSTMTWTLYLGPLFVALGIGSEGAR